MKFLRKLWRWLAGWTLDDFAAYGIPGYCYLYYNNKMVGWMRRPDEIELVDLEIARAFAMPVREVHKMREGGLQ